MRPRTLAATLLGGALLAGAVTAQNAPGWTVAVFEGDITIPIGHACMGGGIADATEITDPLLAKGFVISGPGFAPVVVTALDWCQTNNDSHDRWRDALAAAAGTTRERVLVASVHQHDAPICDLTAQALLDAHGLPGASCDPAFHEEAVVRTAAALRDALANARPVTHFGTGRAEVERIASNRRVVAPDGRIHWGRGSSSGDIHEAPVGEIDPWLRTLSLWDGDRAVVAWSCYAVHPMSRYGRGAVSADFPGLARSWRQRETPDTFQIYFTGCAGDTTAGKFNDGDPANRTRLAERLHAAMVKAWQATERHPIDDVVFRLSPLRLPVREGGDFSPVRMRAILADPAAARWDRIRAALGLSWRQRVAAGQAIDIPCLEFRATEGMAAPFVVMPAETFVGYQRIAQRLRPDAFVMTAGFGDGAPGYLPTDESWRDGYRDEYCWVEPMTETVMTAAMAEALGTRGGDGKPPR